MLTELERYADQTSTELLLGWLWGTTIKNADKQIYKRVFWNDGTLTITIWEHKGKNSRYFRHIDTKDFANATEYHEWRKTITNGNGVI